MCPLPGRKAKARHGNGRLAMLMAASQRHMRLASCTESHGGLYRECQEPLVNCRQIFNTILRRQPIPKKIRPDPAIRSCCAPSRTTKNSRIMERRNNIDHQIIPCRTKPPKSQALRTQLLQLSGWSCPDNRPTSATAAACQSSATPRKYLVQLRMPVSFPSSLIQSCQLLLPSAP